MSFENYEEMTRNSVPSRVTSLARRVKRNKPPMNDSNIGYGNRKNALQRRMSNSNSQQSQDMINSRKNM